MYECCTAGYPATLANAHVHSAICSENKGLLLRDLCKQFIAKDHKYYLTTLATAHVHSFIC